MNVGENIKYIFGKSLGHFQNIKMAVTCHRQGSRYYIYEITQHPYKELKKSPPSNQLTFIQDDDGK